MANYNDWEKRSNHGAGSFKKKSFGDRGGRGFGGGDRGGFDRPKFQATCAECGERCEVPFKPVQGKPVFCNNCFRKDEAPRGDRHFQRNEERGGFNKRFDGPRFDAPRGGDANRTEFEQMNRKLDAIIELLKNFKPQPAKEVKAHLVAEEIHAPSPKAEKAVEAKAEDMKPAKKKAAKAEKKPAKKAKK